MTAPYVIGIGNAVMDVIATASDASLGAAGHQKGSCKLIDRERSEIPDGRAIGRDHAQKARLIPGGSVANTLASGSARWG